MVLAHRYLVNGKRRAQARLTTERPQVCMPFLRVGKGRVLGGGVGNVRLFDHRKGFADHFLRILFVDIPEGTDIMSCLMGLYGCCVVFEVQA